MGRMPTYTSYKDFKYRRRNRYMNGAKLGEKKPPAYCWCLSHRGYLSFNLIKKHKCEKKKCSFYERLDSK